jgi:hypothetical protein
MNLLEKSIRWTQSCPRTGGGLLRRPQDIQSLVIYQLAFLIVIWDFGLWSVVLDPPDCSSYFAQI